jgi:chorismate dehydratase
MNYLYPVRVGELSFTNTVPFRLAGRWCPMPCSSPRLLAQWAEEDRIDAGVIPVVDAWRLEDRFDALGPFGIAVKRRARSVLLFSKRPWTDLDGAVVGVTDQTSTSVQLLKLLMEVRDGFSILLRDGFHSSDEARLVIGDSALAPDAELADKFPYIADLAEEWHAWHGSPFVFARWVVRKTVPPYLREELVDSLADALDHFKLNQQNLCRQSARFLKIPARQVLDYLNGFVYRLGPAEEEAETLFRALVIGRKRRTCC